MATGIRLLWWMTVLGTIASGANDASALEALPTEADETRLLDDDTPVERARRRAIFAVYWENDGTVIKPNNPTDRHYTNGNAINIAFQPRWAAAMAHHMPFAESFGPARTAAGFTLGQMMYTPENLTARRPLPDDWPYNGYLYGGVYWQRSKRPSTGVATLDHFQLEVGVTGEGSGAESAQQFIHELRDLVDPRGWDNQPDDEFAAQFILRKKWRLDVPIGEDAEAGGREGLHMQLVPQVGGQIGTVFRQLEADLMVRAGWNLPDDFGPGRIRDLPDATGDLTRGWSFYAYTRASAMLVQHNAMLHGRDFSLEEEPLTGDLHAGVVLSYGWENLHFEVSYSQTLRADRFRGQARSDAYGAIGGTLRWRY